MLVFYSSCGELTPASTVPIVTTNPITGITYTTAILGSNVTDDGDEPITARGICWSANSSPTINDQLLNANTDLFTSNILGLVQQGGTYYVRTFATNSEVTSYGNEEVFDSMNLDSKSWAFKLNYGPNNNNYPGDVDFYADGTVRWEEPDYPDLYTTSGFWSVSVDVVKYNFTGDPADLSYVFTCTSNYNSTMSGVFTWGNDPDNVCAMNSCRL